MFRYSSFIFVMLLTLALELAENFKWAEVLGVFFILFALSPAYSSVRYEGNSIALLALVETSDSRSIVLCIDIFSPYGRTSLSFLGFILR